MTANPELPFEELGMRAAPPESLRPRELPFAGNEALQLRLLTGEIDVSEPVDRVAKRRVRRIAKEGVQAVNLEPIKLAAKAARHEYWYGNENPYEGKSFEEQLQLYEQQMAKWRVDANAFLDTARTDEDKAKILDHFGLNTDDENNPFTADDMYDKYLKTDDQVETFIETAERLDSATILQQEALLLGLANAFGEEPAQGIKELIHGIKNARTNVDALLIEADRTMDDLSDNELLQDLQDLKTRGEKVTQWQQDALEQERQRREAARPPAADEPRAGEADETVTDEDDAATAADLPDDEADETTPPAAAGGADGTQEPAAPAPVSEDAAKKTETIFERVRTTRTTEKMNKDAFLQYLSAKNFKNISVDRAERIGNTWRVTFTANDVDGASSENSHVMVIPVSDLQDGVQQGARRLGRAVRAGARTARDVFRNGNSE